MEERQFRLQIIPDPFGDDFAGGVFKAGDVVQIMVVELFPVGLEGFGDFRVVHQPAELLVALAGDDDFGAEAVAVEAPAFVILGQVRQ